MSKSRDIADSAATINYIDDLTSAVQSQIDAKSPLSNPTFTGTVTATAFSGDGSALTGVDSLPSQTSNSGKFLTTNGSAASWAEAGGGMQSMQVFISSGTWTRPAGITKIKVTVTGAGGAGGGAEAYYGQPGGGGGAGGTAIRFLDVSAISSVVVTIGAGGTGVAGSSNGNAGGNSSFGSYAQGNGGSGGGGRQNPFGGNRGGASYGDINISGGTGNGCGSEANQDGSGGGAASYHGGGGGGLQSTNRSRTTVARLMALEVEEQSTKQTMAQIMQAVVARQA